MSQTRSIVAILILTLSFNALFAGTRQEVWVLEDFESYKSPMDIYATGLTEGGPWWDAYVIDEILKGNFNAQPKSEFTLERGDPNAFTALGELEADPDDPNDLPQGMMIHYEFENSNSADLLMLAHYTGLPLTLMPSGFYAVDLSVFDKAQIKVKILPGSQSSPQSAFTLSFISWDTSLIGYYKAQRTDLPDGIMGSFQDVWQTMEFDLSAPFQGKTDPPDLTSVAAIVFGIEDSGNTNVTFLVDDFVFYKESDPCPQYLPADITGDCSVDMNDLAELGSQWLK